jgi:type I restriction enzyme, S subunit
MLPIAEVPFETTLNQDMKAVLPSPEVNARFLRFALQSKAQRSLATLRKAGTTVASIDSKALMHMQVPVPPLDEQHRIVALLENHLSRLDAARNYLEACQSRSSRLQPPLPGGAPVRLGDLVREMRYGTSVKCSYDASGPAVLRIPNVVRGNLDLTDLKYATSGDDLGAFRLRAGDVLVIRSNGSLSLIGRMAAVDGTPPEPVAFASYLIRVRVDDERLSPHWLTSLAGLPEVRGQIEGSAASSAGQHNLNKTTLLNLRIPMPSLNDQEAWLAQARELRASTDRLRADVGTAVKHGRRLQASLLEAAFAGLL